MLKRCIIPWAKRLPTNIKAVGSQIIDNKLLDQNDVVLKIYIVIVGSHS